MELRLNLGSDSPKMKASVTFLDGLWPFSELPGEILGLCPYMLGIES